MSLNTIIHIGFPKTGSTTHQNHLFSKHSQVHFLGKPYPDERFREEFYRLIKQESTIYSPEPLKDYMNSLWRSGKEKSGKEKKVVVISDEIMVSVSKVRDKGVVADRLKTVFGSGGTAGTCKILITIRNQFDILKSTYISGCRLLTNVPARYKGRFVGFEEWLEYSCDNQERSHIGNFIYSDTIEYYNRLFGKDNVMVGVFEEFVRDKEEYIRKLTKFMDIDMNEAMELVKNAHDNERMEQSRLEFEHLVGSRVPVNKGRTIYAALRGYGAIRKFIGLGKSAKARVDISPDWNRRLTEIYRQGNRQLIDTYGLPLERYGYPH